MNRAPRGHAPQEDPEGFHRAYPVPLCGSATNESMSMRALLVVSEAFLVPRTSTASVQLMTFIVGPSYLYSPECLEEDFSEVRRIQVAILSS